ncbi:hypothetical protein LTS18_010124, partial [Coniosporium uncinatum]
GNIVGQTPLMAAVQVNNCLDHSCFPELLEILGPLIEVRDAQNRTILHHIAVSCGIKGRAASSKYYLEALLEFLVRNTSAGNAGPNKPIGLMRFMSEMVNARDKGGNTALNLVARIGNRSIIQQLLEVQADPSIPNYKGLRPIDFGVGTDPTTSSSQQQQHQQTASQPEASTPGGGAAARPTNSSKVEELNRELLPSNFPPSLSLSLIPFSNLHIQTKANKFASAALQSTLTMTSTSFATELQTATALLDRTTAAIREFSALQASEAAKLERLQRRQRMRTERTQRLSNLRRAVDEMKKNLLQQGVVREAAELRRAREGGVRVGDAEKGVGGAVGTPIGAGAAVGMGVGVCEADCSADALTAMQAGRLPPGHPLNTSPTILRARIAAYGSNNDRLRQRVQQLRSRSGQLEGMYRKVVSLCTGVEESRVEEMLGGLVVAVESEGAGGGLQRIGGPGVVEGSGAMEVGRVREFLRKVDGVVGS